MDQLRNVNLLLAEDNEVSATVAVRTLQRSGLTRIRVVHDGQQAVDAAKDGSFDIVLMDCQMPVMDGFRATKTLKELGCKTPVIALTASATQDEQHACFASGMCDVVLKPFKADDLVTVIVRWADRARLSSSLKIP